MRQVSTPKQLQDLKEECKGKAVMGREIEVLFVGSTSISYIERDLQLLRKHFNIRVVDSVISKKNLKDAFMTILRIIRGTLRADVTFSWFVTPQAVEAVLLSKMLRRKSIVVAGGFDAVIMPDIDYGTGRSAIRKSLPLFTYLLADRVLAFSESSKQSIMTNYTGRARVETVYLGGIDTSTFIPKGPKEDLVITVGEVINSNLKRKGLQTFVAAGEYLPDVRFVLIGEHRDNSIDYLRTIKPPNVELVGHVKDEQLLEYYQKAKVYVQVSAHEGFGIALAEAMSCGCVPVVTDRGAIPEVVADTGFYVPWGDAKATAGAVKNALKSDKGEAARQRIQGKFTSLIRENRLVQIINEVAK